MSYNRLHNLYGDLHTNSHVLDTEFFNDIENGRPIYKRWTIHNDRVYISYYNNGKPYIEERFYDKNNKFISNEITIKDLMHFIRRKKINKILSR